MTAHAGKSITFVSYRRPYGSDGSQICLDLVLASSVYDQQVNYLFVDDGVFQLLINQQAKSIGSKTLTAGLGALELYGVDKVYADRASLEQRSLHADDLIDGVELIDKKTFVALIRQADTVFTL